MLKLYSTKQNDVVYSFLTGRKYTVGRKQADILLADDQSISRHHADIEVDHPRANYDNPQLLPTLMITDMGSKFGTFLNDAIDTTPPIGINMREPTSLENGGRVRFGRQWSEFRVEYTPLVVTGSTLKDAKDLKETVGTLGGHMVPEWVPECQFTAMDTVTLTIKAVCALLSGKFIVTPDYFKDLMSNAQTNKNVTLDPLDYIPPCAEKIDINFQPLSARTKLFKNKTFIFHTNKQMKKLGTAIKCGSGEIKLIGDCSNRELESSNTLMVQPGVALTLLDEKTSAAVETYKEGGKRLIQESEISLAAVYVSIAKHCNPYFAMSKVFAPPPSQSQASGSVIIPETQSTAETQRSDFGEQSRVEESFNLTSASDKSNRSTNSTTSLSSSARVKVEANEDNIISSNRSHASKRTHQEVMDSSSTTSSSSKRRLEHETETPEFVEPGGPCPKKQKSSALSSQSTTKKTLTKSKTISALFNSDSDSDEDELDVIPASIDPESQSQSRASVAPAPAADYDFVGVKKKHLGSPNKKHGPESVSVPTTSTKKSKEVTKPDDDHDDVDYVPGTPEMSDDENDRFEGLIYDVEDSAKGTKSVSKGKPSEVISLSDDDDVSVVEPTRKSGVNRSVLPTAALPTMALPTMPIAGPSTSYEQRSTRTKKLVQATLPFKVEGSSSQAANKRKKSSNADSDDDEESGSSKITNKKPKTIDVSKKLKELEIDDDDEDIKFRPKLNIAEAIKPPEGIPCDSLIRVDRPSFILGSSQHSSATNNNSSVASTSRSSANSSSATNFKFFKKIWPLTSSNDSSSFRSSEQSINQTRRTFVPKLVAAAPLDTLADENENPEFPDVVREATERQQRVENPESESDDDEFLSAGRISRATREQRTRGKAVQQTTTGRQKRGGRSTIAIAASPERSPENIDNDSPINNFNPPADDDDPSEGLFDFD